MRLSLLLTLICISITFHGADRQLPHIYCKDPPSLTYECRLNDVFLTRDQPRYTIISTGVPYDEVTFVNFFAYDQKLPIFSPDFCETFPLLRRLDVTGTSTESIDQDAFYSCFYLEILDMAQNQIQVLPTNLFWNNLHLKHVGFEGNRLSYISVEQFEMNHWLEKVSFENNFLMEFPVSAVRNCHEMQNLRLYSNNLVRLDAAALVNIMPNLQSVLVNGNLFPCSAMEHVLTPFRHANVMIIDYYKPKSFPYRMSTMDDHTCVQGQ